MIWSLEDFADFDLSTRSNVLSRKCVDHIKPRLWSCLMLVSSSHSSRCMTLSITRLRASGGFARHSALDLPQTDDVVVRVVGKSDRWSRMGQHWMRVHELPRAALHLPQLEEDGPDISSFTSQRVTFKSYDDGDF